MNITNVAKRYALALFKQAKSDDSLDVAAGDARFILECTEASHELKQLLKSQITSRKAKEQVFKELFEDKSCDLTRLFLKLVLEKRREAHLENMFHAFLQLYRKNQGSVDIEVMVAVQPDQDQIRALTKALERKTGSKISLFINKNPALKGGMAVRIDDTVIDGTVKHKLQLLENKFLQAGV